MSPEAFVASEAWRPARPESLVVCCSDGRWHEQVEEFIRAQVSERADVYAVPGGAASFYWWNSSFEESHVLEKAFRFLAEHHQIRFVWLIAHEDCAYYKAQCGYLDADQLRQRQEEDLERACTIITGWFPQLLVRKVYASRNDDCIVFTVLPAGRAK
jgi:hypothetical protein